MSDIISHHFCVATATQLVSVVSRKFDFAKGNEALNRRVSRFVPCRLGDGNLRARKCVPGDMSASQPASMREDDSLKEK